MRTLNLGILAHVDAGKTSLTERLLLHAGVVKELGRVDAGTTRTDSMALERARGITIRAAVASLTLPTPDGDLRVNLVDTPGHPDFIAEVERVLAVLDGVVLVVSAVEGVQPQTRILMRATQRLGLPVAFFVNKLDRRGADLDRVSEEIAARLTSDLVAMGTASGEGTRAAAFTPYADPAGRALEALAEHDDVLLGGYVAGTINPDRARASMAAQTRAALVHPVFGGSAVTGAGIGALVAGLTWCFAPPTAVDDALAAAVFSVDRAGGRPRAWVRVFGGEIAVRDKVALGDQRPRRVTALLDAAGEPVQRLLPGDIGALVGLDGVRVGSAIGRPPRAVDERLFRSPSLDAVVRPVRPDQKVALLGALAELAAQDPLISFRHDDSRDEIGLALFGEVQKEVIAARLAAEYGVPVRFGETTPQCVERPAGTGAAYELIATPTNPYLATVGIRVDPAEPGAGTAFALAVEPGSMPAAFFNAVRDAVTDSLRQGRHGWPVTDVRVTMTHSGYWARQSAAHATFSKAISSTAGDFRHLTPMLVATALDRAGTVVCEPIRGFRLDAPVDQLAGLLGDLPRWRAQVLDTAVTDSEVVLRGLLPAAEVHDLQTRLPDLTRGEGVLETEPDHFRPVTTDPPARQRAGVDPLDRENWVKAHPR